MFEKILTPLLFLGAQFIIAWYGYFSGKMPAKGTYLGFHYDSIFARSLITQFEYLWVLIIINLFFSMGFNLGFGSYKNFLVIALIWMASGPIAALLFNTIFVKEKLDPALIFGIIFITIGAVCVVAHKELLQVF